MSPSRTRKPIVHARPRAEVVTAVAAGAAVVLGTALLVWLMRPGTAGVPAGGGLMNRQPRVTWLIVLTIAGGAAFGAWMLRGRRRPRRLSRRAALAVIAVVVVVGSVLGGVFWPGGVVKHWPARPKPFKPPVTTLPSIPPTTTAPSPSTTARP
jgi:hypothetical protein